MLSRSEFYTAYTPYQPEISQGTLQAIFEYQSMICNLTGMDVSNASMYDGATALAEAIVMACNARGQKNAIIANTVHPESRDVVNTYSRFNGINITEISYKDGTVDLEKLEAMVNAQTGCVVIQSPNFFGCIEDLKAISDIAHKHKAFVIASVDPISLAVLKSPGDLGCDIAVGDGQPLGNPLNFGGPYFGFFAAKKEFVRKMPGRIVGETTDKNGKRGFVLTIQTREQHIRREKATSNICSNQALNALAATIYLSTMGPEGLCDVATQCMKKARYTYDKLVKTGKFKPLFNAPFFKEFVVSCSTPIDDINKKLINQNIIGGLGISDMYPELDKAWLIAVTEKRNKNEIDSFVEKAVNC
jgi:glycine dehydrogenase subunit 1